MTTRTHTYWRAPALMMAAMLLGILFAVSHHAFYQHLNQKRTPTRTRTFAGFETSQQQINATAGTAFAFLVKAFLTTAVGVAFIQVFWRTLTAATKPMALARVDTSFSLQSNLLSLVTVRHWWRYPLLFLLGLLTWLMPLASVVTPGTLTVQMKASASSNMTYVPYINFTSLTYAAGLYPDSDQASFVNETMAYWWNGPSQVVKRLASAVGAQGTVLPITPSSANSSYEHDFWGPSLKCMEMSNDRILRIQQSVANYTTAGNCYEPNLYLAWYGDVPFVSLLPNGTYDWTTGSLASPDLGYGGNNATMSIAIMPNMAQSIKMSTHVYQLACERSGWTTEYPLGSCEAAGLCLTENSTYLDCQMFNTSYNVAFNYHNGEQSVAINAPDRDADQPVHTIAWVNGPISSGDSTPNHTCIWRGEGNPYGKTGYTCSDSDPQTVQTLAYQGMMQAFTDIVGGYISSNGAEAGYNINSSITSTTLLNTKELAFLSDEGMQRTSNDLQWMLQLQDFGGYAASKSQTRDQTQALLASTIEALFQNYTVSLVSEPLLQPNISADALLQTKVKTISYDNFYTYSASRLWLAYGLAIAATAIAVAIGLFIMFSDGASYSNNFSTILRSAHAIELSADIRPEDAHGEDPLPPHLAKATVEMTKVQVTAISQVAK